MGWQHYPYVISLVIAGAVSATLALPVWRRRPVSTGPPLALYLLAASQWSLAYALQLASVDLTAKLFWRNVLAVGASLAPVAWLALVLHYTGRAEWLTRRNTALLTLQPLTGLLMTWTNEFHGLMYSDARLDTAGPFPVMDSTDGVWLRVSAAYTCLLLGVGLILLVQAFARRPPANRRQVGALLLVGSTPWATTLASTLGLNPFRPVDPVPFSFVLAGLALIWILGRLRLPDVMRLARGALIKETTDGVVVLDSQNRIVDINPAVERIIGRSPEQTIGLPVSQVISVPAGLKEDSRFSTAADQGATLGAVDIQDSFDLRIAPLCDRRGRLRGRLVTLRDTARQKGVEIELRQARDELEAQVRQHTAELARVNKALRAEMAERSRVEEALQQRANKFQAILEGIEDGYIELDIDGNLISFNDSMSRILGYSASEMLGANLGQSIDPDASERVAQVLNRVRESGEPVESFDFPIVRMDGEKRHLETSISLIRSPDGEPTGFRGIARDITERRKLEEIWRRYAFIVDTSREFMTLIDRDLTYVTVNESYCSAHARTQEEILGRTVAHVWGDETYRNYIKKHLDRCFAGHEVHYQTQFEFAGLGQRWIDVAYYPYHHGKTDVTHVVVVSHDITEYKQVEKALRERAREINLLYEAGCRLGRTLDPEKVYRALHDFVSQVMECDDLSVSSYDSEDNLIRCAFARHEGKRLDVTRLPPIPLASQGTRFRSVVIRTGEPLLIRDYESLWQRVESFHHTHQERVPIEGEFPDATQIRSALLVPLKSDGRAVGVIQVSSYRHGAYTEDDLRFLEALALQVAAASKNALLYQQAQSEIAERARAEGALRASEEKFRSVAQSAHDAIVSVDSHMKIVFWNQGAEVIFGYSSDEALGQSLDMVIPDQAHPAHHGVAQQLRAGIEPRFPARAFEITGVRKGGEEFPAELTLATWRTKTSRFHTSVVRDISERKQAEIALAKAHAQSQQYLASISSILISVDAENHITHWNAPAEVAFGIASAQAVGRPLPESGIQWDWGEIATAISDCPTALRPVHLSDIRYVRPDGKEGLLNITLNPFGGDGAEQSGCLLLAEEITERKALETQLAQAQKLEAIGQLAAGVAHEINTPIQYIGDNTSFLQDAFADISGLLSEHYRLLLAARTTSTSPALVAKIERAREDVDVDYLLDEIPTAIQQSLEGIGHVTEIVRALREFSHPSVAEKKAIDINSAIESTVAVARNEWKYVADVDTDYADLPLVPCLPGEFNQAILNLLINAAHAIADAVGDGATGKGTISISTRLAGDWVEIRLGDTGTGIPEEVQPRIFDPFFTTKDVGKGTGQGLAIAHNVIVEKHGGTIAFETEVGKGTTFTVRLPIAAVHQ